MILPIVSPKINRYTNFLSFKYYWVLRCKFTAAEGAHDSMKRSIKSLVFRCIASTPKRSWIRSLLDASLDTVSNDYCQSVMAGVYDAPFSIMSVTTRRCWSSC